MTEDGNPVSHYGYDGDDNRTTFTNASGTIKPAYDAQDRLMTYGTAKYKYGQNGELQSKTVGGQQASYVYDAFGNLLSGTLPSGEGLSYVIDGQNRRVGKRVNGALTEGFLYQDQLNVIAQVNASGTVVSRFVFGTKPNAPDYYTTSTGTFQIVSDHLGSPRLVVNTANGSIVEEIDYDEFGNVTMDTAPGLARTGLGQQRIASQLMIRPPGPAGTLPLHTSFALMNQRYTLDAHVLSNLSYDRVRSTAKRMMPLPLDVAFAALGNDGAAELLRGELDRYGYAPDLHLTRVIASAHGDDYWQKSLQSTWTAALRALSPTPEGLKPPQEGGLPSVATTRAWNARILNTQLASWAELRHDTILYAKQSYSLMPTCEFPDAYVDPYPEFFHRISLHARLGEALATEVLAGSWIESVDRAGLFEFKPTIADVHTQATDEDGRVVGRVLHVGTGSVNGMVVTVDSCGAPRAYAGYVSSYYEKTTSNFERLDDPEWARELRASPAPDPPAWLGPLLER